MTIELNIPDSIHSDPYVIVEFKAFLQQVVNRKCVGALRYGDKPNRRKQYMSRLKKELEVYKKTGNFEQLLNIAVYAFLESAAPENRKFHFDATVESATRGEFGV